MARSDVQAPYHGLDYRAVMLAGALQLIAVGWHVFPVFFRRKKGGSGFEKIPAMEKWPVNATTDVERVHQLWSSRSKGGVGIAHAPSNTVALDVDSAAAHGADGTASLRELEREHEALPLTPMFTTATGGRQYLFRRPPELAKMGGENANANIQAIRPGLDLIGGFSVVPPSRNELGVYAWRHGPDVEPADMPAWLVEIALEHTRSARAVGPGPNRSARRQPIPERIPDGERRPSALRLAGAMRKQGSSADEIFVALRKMADDRFETPSTDAELWAIARDFENRYDAEPYQLPATVSASGEHQSCVPGQHRLDDVGNAERFTVLYGDRVRWNEVARCWLIWDGRRWKPDDTKALERLAKKAARSIFAEAAASNDDELTERVAKHAGRSANATRIRAMLDLAKSDLAVHPSELDSDPWLLNVANGTIDLRTGELKPHDPSDLITQLSPVLFDPSVTSDVWDRFLRDATNGDAELAEGLQRAAGYSLAGVASEEKFFFIYGPAATGKSTFVEALRTVQGDYSVTIRPESLLRRRDVGGPRPDIARTEGKRLVVTEEIDRRRQLDEPLIKAITGGTLIAARALHQNPREFLPAFTLWMVGNDRPDATDTDSGIWRRMRVLPFDHEIPEGARDPAVKGQLTDPDSVHARAVLAWAVAGCLKWQRDGLPDPDRVLRATAEYRAEMNPLAAWIAEESVVFGPEYQTPSTMLWSSYRNHTEAAREQTIAQRDFYERLRALGCRPGRTGQSRFWKGVGIGVTPNGPDADVGDIEPRNVGVTRRPSAVTASGGVILGNGADICREREVSTDRCDTNDVEIGKNGLTTPHEEDFTDSAVTGVTVSQTSNQEAGGKRSKDTPR